MLKAQQVSVSPGQTPVAPGQIPVVPTTGVAAAGFEDITSMITAIMPLIMLVLMFQMLKPLLAGMAAEKK